MSRRVLIPLVLVGIALFLVISFELARFLNTESQERGAVFTLLQAQARGDAAAMIAQIDGCAKDPACIATARRNARGNRRPGDVKILAYDSETAYALGAKSGRTRVAWTVINRGLPVVQCVDVERTGTVLAGRTIRLRRLSLPIDRQGTC